MSPHTRLDYSSFGFFSNLFESYCGRFDEVAEYYSIDYRRPSAYRDAAENTLRVRRDRNVLADVLAAQNERWNSGPRTRANIDRLRDPDSVAVVTGQQVGLFTGPIYTLYKTVTTVQLAREMERATGHATVPVFWLEGEDHDIEEANRATFNKGTQPVTISCPTDQEGPVGRIVFDETIQDALGQVKEVLPPTDFRDGVLKLLAGAYAPGVTYLDAFARLLQSMLPDEGLVLISSDDERLKRTAAPLFEKEASDFEASYGRLSAASHDLARRFHAQIHPGQLNLFILHEGRRLKLDPSGDSISVRGSDLFLSRNEIIDRIRNEPSQFSPNVALRPLLQDYLLPTAAYVAGPAEVAYFAQLKSLYGWFEIPMPMIYPRAGVTLIEPRVRKVLDTHGIGVAELAAGADGVVKRLVKSKMAVDLDLAFSEAVGQVSTVVDRLRELAESVDGTLGRSAGATQSNVLKELQGLKKRIERAAKRNEEGLQSAVEKASASLFPDNKLQERTFTAASFMTKYGVDLAERLLNELSLDTTRHQLLDL